MEYEVQIRVFGGPAALLRRSAKAKALRQKHVEAAFRTVARLAAAEKKPPTSILFRIQEPGIFVGDFGYRGRRHRPGR